MRYTINVKDINRISHLNESKRIQPKVLNPEIGQRLHKQERSYRYHPHLHKLSPTATSNIVAKEIKFQITYRGRDAIPTLYWPSLCT